MRQIPLRSGCNRHDVKGPLSTCHGAVWSCALPSKSTSLPGDHTESSPETELDVSGLRAAVAAR
eukprot:6278358-Amphidinium_carterae.1